MISLKKYKNYLQFHYTRLFYLPCHFIIQQTYTGYNVIHHPQIHDKSSGVLIQLPFYRSIQFKPAITILDFARVLQSEEFRLIQSQFLTDDIQTILSSTFRRQRALYNRIIQHLDRNHEQRFRDDAVVSRFLQFQLERHLVGVDNVKLRVRNRRLPSRGVVLKGGAVTRTSYRGMKRLCISSFAEFVKKT